MKKQNLKLYIIAFLIGVCLLSFSFKKAKAESDCNAFIKDGDYSSIQVIDRNYSGQVEKGDSFAIVINNGNNYSLRYSYEIFDSKNKKIGSKTGSITKGGEYSEGIITNSYKAGDYKVAVKLYNTERNCLLKSQTSEIKIVGEEKAPSGVTFYNKGDVQIGSPDKKIEANGNFRVTINNTSSTDYNYELKVDNLGTNNFVRKSFGSVGKGTAISTWATITSPGSHKVQANIYYTTGGSPVLSQTFEVEVTSPKETVPVNKTEVASSAPETASLPLKDLQPITHSKFNISLGSIFQKVFPRDSANQPDPSAATLDSVSELIWTIINYAVDLAGLVTFIMILWAARIFLNAYGSEEAYAMAKKTLTWALVGLALVLLSKGILLWLYGVFAS